MGVLHRLPLPDPSAPPALPSRLRAWVAAATEAAEKLAADAAEAKAEEAAGNTFHLSCFLFIIS